MINRFDSITEEITEEPVDPAIRKVRKLFRIGGSILLISGIATLIIGLTSGIALIPIIIGGYLTASGALNLVLKI